MLFIIHVLKSPTISHGAHFTRHNNNVTSRSRRTSRQYYLSPTNPYLHRTITMQSQRRQRTANKSILTRTLVLHKPPNCHVSGACLLCTAADAEAHLQPCWRRARLTAHLSLTMGHVRPLQQLLPSNEHPKQSQIENSTAADLQTVARCTSQPRSSQAIHHRTQAAAFHHYQLCIYPPKQPKMNSSYLW